jgi:serine/threonine protein kinase
MNTLSDSHNTMHVIGEGSYGCVLKPSLKCKTTRPINYKNKISKIMEKSEAIIELEEYKRIEKVDKNANYYTGNPEMCIPEISKKNMNAIKQCKYRNIEDLRKYYLLIMEDGGQSLTVFADSIYEEIIRGTLRYDSKEFQDYQKIMYNFWEECKRLFMGLQLFLKNNLVHHDLKPQNILYDIQHNRVNYIDFGLMTTKKEIRENSINSYNHNAIIHWSFPPEMPYTNKSEYMKLVKMNKQKKIKVFERFMKNLSDSENKINYFFKNTVLDYYKKEESETIKNHLKEYYDLLLKEMTSKKYNIFLEGVINSIDTYGLGLSLLYVLNKTQLLIDPLFAKNLRSLFLNMVNFNVMERKNIKTLIYEYNEIMKKYSTLFKQNTLRYKESYGKTKKFIEQKLESIEIENANISNKKLDMDPIPLCPKSYKYNSDIRHCIKSKTKSKSNTKSKSITRKIRM